MDETRRPALPAPSPIAAVVERGAGIEAWHGASVAVVDGSGHLIASFGDPALSTMTRSAIKPFQATALVESGAARALAVPPEELAIACASHSGTDAHVRVVERLLARSGAQTSDLGCGAHLPIGYRLDGRLPLAGEDQDPLRNNCSGKHAGFLALARWLGEPFAEYLAPDSRTQALVRRTIARICNVSEEHMPRGIDGCGAPNYALPLEALARGILELAQATPGHDTLTNALATIRDAMTKHPFLVSGERRFDYDLMCSFPANVVCKAGAEAIQLIGFRNPPLGIAVKVQDGASRALPPICVSVLAQLGLLPAEPPAPLHRHRHPHVKNHRGLTVGRIAAVLELERRSGRATELPAGENPG